MKRVKGRTVALVGFAGLTLPYAAESMADEFWTMNHAYKVIGGSLPRIDRLFEMHEEAWIRRKEQPSSAEYWEWLKQGGRFPVYMQEKHAEIPNSVRFPMEEVNADLFGRFRLTSGEMVKFYTSSFSYMMALAIYKKFERIEVYGIEMRTGTEYGYQYPGGAFMMGVAVGRGIEVVVRPESHLCRAKLYGYGTAPYASRDVMERYQVYYETEVERLREVMEVRREAWNGQGNVERRTQNEDRERVLTQALDAFAAWAVGMGALQMVQTLLAESDEFSSRQKMEGWQGQFRAGLEKWKAEANYRRAIYNQMLEGVGEVVAQEDADGKFAEWMEAWEVMHKYDGGLQVLEKLLAECDLLFVEMGVERRIVEVEE